jgi:hypothetical protein
LLLTVPQRTLKISSDNALMQWQATGCHMALLFRADGQFLKITHQYTDYVSTPSSAECSCDEINLGTG